jgi:hypothetical protein
MSKRLLKNLCLGLTQAVMLTGCALPPALSSHLPAMTAYSDEAAEPVNGSGQTLAAGLIIEDLVYALGFALSPVSSTIQVNVSHSDLTGQRFVRALAEAGYGIQWVAGDEGARFFSYSTMEKASGNGIVSEVYRMSVGSIDVERSYTLSVGGNVIPDGALMLGGSQANVVLDDIRFETTQPLSFEVSQVGYMAATPMDDTAPRITSFQNN